MSVLFRCLLKLGYNLLVTLPVLAFSIPDDLVSEAVLIFSGIAYFLPMRSLILLLDIKILVVIFRISVAVFKFVKSFIPGISGG